MTQTIGTRAYRDKYKKAAYQQVLRKALIAEAICEVDNSDNKRIQNPYSNQPTATVQAISGTYGLTDWQLTDDTLTVTDEVIYAEHIHDFEDILTQFDLFADRIDNQAYAIAYQIDYFVINNLCNSATGSYKTPAGGFTTAANMNEIFGNLIGKVAGFADAYRDLFIVLENTDYAGLAEAGATNGFNFADSVLKNGIVGNWMGVDIYIVRSGTFVTTTIGTVPVTNDEHRVFGVKGVSTYASPRGIRFQEKEVSLKTGMELVTFGYVGFKLWTQKASLIIDIELA